MMSIAPIKQTIADDKVLQQWDRFHPFEVRKQLVEQVLARAKISNEALALSMVEVYKAQREQYRCVTPSALETLQKLRQEGVRLALLTNGNATYQRRKIAQYHLANFFDSILFEEEYGIGKPDPRIYQEALALLSLTAPETWMVGDNLQFDIEASQQLGIFACWFDPYQQGLPQHTKIHPDGIIHTFPELLGEVLALPFSQEAAGSGHKNGLQKHSSVSRQKSFPLGGLVPQRKSLVW